MNCPACGRENPDGAKFCNQCAGPLPLRCLKCGTSNPAGSRFCNECAAPLTAGSTTLSTTTNEQIHSEIQVNPEQFDSSSAPAGERKTVTTLFADIKGSMDLMEDIDPEEARAIVDPALKLMIDAVHRYDGDIVQSTGDGIFALFGAPIAHEDHPQRALYAALRMQEAMRVYAERLRADKGLNLQVRIGVNIGEVVVRSIQTGAQHTEYSPIGHSTSLAARLQTLATPGSTVISGNMRGLVEGYFQLKGLGPTRIKGVSEPVEVFEVTGLGPLRTRLQRAAGRGFSKFVGRQREIEAMRHTATLAKDGRGQLVAVMAEPGVGKSRLFYEFKLRSQSGWMVLEAFSVSHGKASSYLPVIAATFFRGWAMAAAAGGEEGIAEMRRSLSDPMIAEAAAPALLLVALAETCGKNGRAEEGLDLVAKGLATAEQTGMRVAEAELHRLKGELLMIEDSGKVKEAELCLRTAIDVAHRQGARLFELRATTSLARLLATRGRRDEARTMLTNIYNWFTEGFELPDLNEAKALLEGLGPNQS
jgi:class 3 adenylate cyclase